jgi:exodeoxyribonuclease VII small subunit
VAAKVMKPGHSRTDSPPQTDSLPYIRTAAVVGQAVQPAPDCQSGSAVCHSHGRAGPVRYTEAMAENESGPKPVESFEACLDELEKVVRELEGGDLTLERSLELFERGMTLSETCRTQLEAAETRVDMLIRKDGKMVAEPFRPDKS